MKQGLPFGSHLASCIPYIVELHSCHDNDVNRGVHYAGIIISSLEHTSIILKIWSIMYANLEQKKTILQRGYLQNC